MAPSVGRLLWASYGFRFSQNLKKIRRKRGVTQQALAEIAGLSRTQVCNLERNENNSGTSADPALSTVYKLALALEVPPALLLPQPEDNVKSVCATPAPRVTQEKIQPAELAEIAPVDAMSAGRVQALLVKSPPAHPAPSQQHLISSELQQEGEGSGSSLQELAPFSPEYTAHKRLVASAKHSGSAPKTAHSQRTKTTRRLRMGGVQLS